MKTKKLFFVIPIILVLVITSTAIIINAILTKDISPLSQTISKETEWKTGRMNEIINSEKNIPLSELSAYKFSELSQYVGSRYLNLNLNSVGNSINWFNDNAKKFVNNIQKIDDDHVAVVYKVSEKDLDETYMFVIFKRSISEGSGCESWVKTGEAYFLNDTHTYEDYSEVKAGDSIEKLYEIDKSIRYDVLRKEISVNTILELDPENINDSKLEKAPRMIFKLLKDGVLTVEYDLDTMSVLETRFYPYLEKDMPKYISVADPKILDCITNLKNS